MTLGGVASLIFPQLTPGKRTRLVLTVGSRWRYGRSLVLRIEEANTFATLTQNSRHCEALMSDDPALGIDCDSLRRWPRWASPTRRSSEPSLQPPLFFLAVRRSFN